MNAKLLCLPLLLSCLSLQAEIYRTVDADGNVVFTDAPGASTDANAEKVTISTPNTINAPSVSPAAPRQSVEPVADYQSLSLSPANDSTIRSNDGNFSVRISPSPSLHPGHKIRFYVDGQLQPGSSLNYQLSNVDRGTHSLKAEVVDADGKVIISQINNVHVQRATAPRPAPRASVEDDEISILPEFDDLISLLPWVDDKEPEQPSAGIQPVWPKDRLISYKDANGNERTRMMQHQDPVWPKDRFNQ